ncbi:MAG: VWA domain-containing protein [Acidobacteria bacterium]|nr:VWA domain-containing protein [Acidobacteriota bacterium]
MKALITILTLLFTLAATAAGQNRCLSSDDAKKVIATIGAAAGENEKLRKELLEMRDEREKLNAKIAVDTEKNQKLIPEANQLGQTQLLRVCGLLRENGWPAREAVKEDGFQAFLFLISNSRDPQAQSELLPVLVEAAKKGVLGNSMLASMVDSIRVGSRMPQIFGTQAVVRNNVVYLYPLLNEEKVDDWRKLYDLPPLVTQIRGLEGRYLMPVLKMQVMSGAPMLQRSNKKNAPKSDTDLLGITDDENEPVRVETKLVSLNVRMLTKDLKPPVGLGLTKDDFSVSEDGVEQEIKFFSSTEQPFDLVLLLDFSGSTFERRGLIKKAAQRFVEYARPSDRIAIVVFATEIRVVSELTTDKAALKDKIKDIDVNGGSPIWDSLRFVYDKILKENSVGRRSAVVFMTDAEDGSKTTTFADAMEIVRRHDTTVFPVYLGRLKSFSEYGERAIRKAQQSLWMLAEETGGEFYKADDPGDLKGIYEQVINQIGQVYSLGYEPKNENRDGGWRNLTVTVKTHPDLVVRTRRGYYAN